MLDLQNIDAIREVFFRLVTKNICTKILCCLEFSLYKIIQLEALEIVVLHAATYINWNSQKNALLKENNNNKLQSLALELCVDRFH